MYGIFTYIWVILGQMLVNIPYMEHMTNVGFGGPQMSDQAAPALSPVPATPA